MSGMFLCLVLEAKEMFPLCSFVIHTTKNRKWIHHRRNVCAQKARIHFFREWV